MDVNALAAGKEYCQLGGIQVSPDNRIMAYSVDYTTGRNLFRVYFRDLGNRQRPD
jgi:oligopeptidase B